MSILDGPVLADWRMWIKVNIILWDIIYYIYFFLICYESKGGFPGLSKQKKTRMRLWVVRLESVQSDGRIVSGILSNIPQSLWLSTVKPGLRAPSPAGCEGERREGRGERGEATRCLVCWIAGMAHTKVVFQFILTSDLTASSAVQSLRDWETGKYLDLYWKTSFQSADLVP